MSSTAIYDAFIHPFSHWLTIMNRTDSYAHLYGLFCHRTKRAFCVFTLFLLPQLASAEFSLNFSSGSNVVGSIANQSCNLGGGGGGMMGGMGGMGMMGGIGPGCSATPFLQEIVRDGGTDYYHVILFDDTEDFALEYYMRTGGCCWWSGGGMMGGMGGMMGGGGDAPYSSSFGNTTSFGSGSNGVDQTLNMWIPLAGPDDPYNGNGSGNPSRIYMRQINNDSQMDQEFLKTKEAMKPRIIQDINSGGTQLAFDLDMSNGGYGSFTNPRSFVNTFSSNQPEVTAFNMATDAPQAEISAGRFSYSTGSGDGGSSGSFNYESNDGFDPEAVDWLSFCDPSQNSEHDCLFWIGDTGGGGMMGGMGGMGM